MATSSPYVVALTGGIGSGKSTVADGFARHQVEIVDADQIAHRLTEPNGLAMAQIEAAFGPAVVNRDGALDRDRMRELAFGNDQQRRELEAILHPMIKIETNKLIQAADSAYVIWMVPLLFESGGDGRGQADRILVVDCPEQLQVARVMARSHLAETQVRAIMTRQVSRETRISKADDVIDNVGSVPALDTDIERLHELYLELSRAKLR